MLRGLKKKSILEFPYKYSITNIDFFNKNKKKLR